MKRIAFCLLFSGLFSIVAFSGGFQVNLQGQKQIGMGHCGTAFQLGASSAFFNPGLYAFTDSCQLSLASSFVFASIDYVEPNPGIYKTSTLQNTGTPFTFFSSFRLKKTSPINFGLAIYTPFGSTVQYEDNWKGQFLLREMSLTTIFFQPTIGLQLGDKIGVGVGYVYAMGNFSLRRGVTLQNQQGEYGEATLNGEGNGHGFNIGINYQPTDNISLGLSYRSVVKVGLDNGDATFSVPSSVEEFFPTTNFTTSIKLPETISLGTALKLSQKTILAVDVNYVGWSSYDTLAFDFADNTEKLDDIASPREYRNATIIRTGIQYKQDENLTLRAGAYYDFTPLQDIYITPENPDADKIGLSVGASYLFSKKLSLDVSLLYVNGFERTATNQETGFGGTWKASAIIPGIGLNYIF